MWLLLTKEGLLEGLREGNLRLSRKDPYYQESDRSLEEGSVGHYRSNLSYNESRGKRIGKSVDGEGGGETRPRDIT